MISIHGKSLAVMKEIKRMLDPKNILNPGKTVESRIPDFLLFFVFKLMKYATPLFIFLTKNINQIPDRFIKISLKLLRGGQ